LAQQRIQSIEQRKTLRRSTRADLISVVFAPLIPYKKCDNVAALYTPKNVGRSFLPLA
jgi:hypothetical protein